MCSCTGLKAGTTKAVLSRENGVAGWLTGWLADWPGRSSHVRPGWGGAGVRRITVSDQYCTVGLEHRVAVQPTPEDKVVKNDKIKNAVSWTH